MLLGFFRKIHNEDVFLSSTLINRIGTSDILIFPSGKLLTSIASSRKTLIKFFKRLSSMYVKGFQWVLYVKHFGG